MEDREEPQVGAPDSNDAALSGALERWRDDQSANWRSVRAVVPAERYLNRLALGEVGHAQALIDDLSELAARPESVSLGCLLRLAERADEVQIAHALRHGAAWPLPDDLAHEACIELTPDGLVWHHPRPEILADTELVRLALGDVSRVVPPALRSACTRALGHMPAEPNRALWWWQRDAQVPAERIATEAGLADALAWSFAAHEADPDAPLPSACLNGTLWLARAAPSPLDLGDASDVCDLIRLSGAGGAIALQGVALGATEDRPSLMLKVGLTLDLAESPVLVLVAEAEPILTELTHAEG